MILSELLFHFKNTPLKRVLIWFRNDLRINDNEALYKACKDSNVILPVFIEQNKPHRDLPFNLEEDSVFKRKFLLESVESLDKSLSSFGGRLLYLKGKAQDIIPELCSEYSIQEVFAMAEYAHDENVVEQELEIVLNEMNINLNLYHTSTLIHPSDLPFRLEELPNIFTSFRKTLEKNLKIRDLYKAPDKILFIELKKHSQERKDERTPSAKFLGGEEEGLKRVNQYIHKEKRILSYKETRNQLLGMDYSTKFSPWLANGSISAKQIYHSVKKFESEVEANQSTYWVVFELFWRDYFRYIMMKFGSSLFKKGGIKKASPEGDLSMDAFNSWKEGETGQPFIDANMKELKQTGFMSNRGRQNVASYLVHDLKVDWRLGASYFEQMLVDYDVYSNWGNWAYIAGVGNDPRENRKFNPERQASMYDPENRFTKYWLDLA